MARRNFTISIPDDLLLGEVRNAVATPKHALGKRARSLINDIQGDPYNAFHCLNAVMAERWPTMRPMAQATIEITPGTKVFVNYNTNSAELCE